MVRCCTLLVILTVTLTPSCSPAQAPPPDSRVPPGTLARDRLGPAAVELLTGAKRVQVALRRWQRPGEPSDMTGCVTVLEERDKDAEFASRLADLLLDDSLYTSEAGVSLGPPGDLVLTFWLWRGQEKARLEVLPAAAQFRLLWKEQGWEHMASGNLLPVADQLWPMLRLSFPNVDIPVPPRPTPPAEVRALPGVPDYLMRRIRSMVPGMRRRDVMKVFTTMGGISTRLQRSYILRADAGDPHAMNWSAGEWTLMVPLRQPPGTVFVSSKSDPFHQTLKVAIPQPSFTVVGVVTVSVEYAAPQQKVVWIGGRGYVLRRQCPPVEGDEDPDDVILSISPPAADLPTID